MNRIDWWHVALWAFMLTQMVSLSANAANYGRKFVMPHVQPIFFVLGHTISLLFYIWVLHAGGFAPIFK